MLFGSIFYLTDPSKTNGSYDTTLNNYLVLLIVVFLLSNPKTFNWPYNGSTNLVIQWIKLVLPAPVLPMIATLNKYILYFVSFFKFQSDIFKNSSILIL